MRGSKLIGSLFCTTIVVLALFVGLELTTTDNAMAGTIPPPIISSDTNWTFDESPYWIEHDVTVTSNATLTIEPGVEVRFNRFYSLFIEGDLNAIGNSTDSVIFTSNLTPPHTNDWGSIKFSQSVYYNSSIRYSTIEFAAIGVYCDNRTVAIENSLIRYNSVGVYATEGGRPLISNNTITNNTQNGIDWMNHLNPILAHLRLHNLIWNNTISNNGDKGINLISYARNPRIDGNDIFSNNNYGIYMNSSSASILNNTITNNTYGVYSVDSSPQIGNSTVPGNNVIKDNTQDGIYLTGNAPTVFTPLAPAYANITGNTNISNNGHNGIYLLNSINTTIKNNNITTNADSGINSSHSYVKILNNTIKFNSLRGIRIVGNDSVGEGARIENNTITNNGLWGIELNNNSNYIAVWFNQIKYNNKYGLSSENSNNVSIYNNTIHANGNTYDPSSLISNIFSYNSTISIKNNSIKHSEDLIVLINSNSSTSYHSIKGNNFSYTYYHDWFNRAILVDNSTALIDSNDFLTVGSGIYLVNESYVNSSYNKIINPRIGIYSNNSNSTIFRNNLAGEEKLVELSNGSYSNITFNSFSASTDHPDDSCIYCENSKGDVLKNEINLTDEYGRGIGSKNCELNIENNTIIGKIVWGSTVGIYGEGGNLKSYYNVLEDLQVGIVLDNITSTIAYNNISNNNSINNPHRGMNLNNSKFFVYNNSLNDIYIDGIWVTHSSNSSIENNSIFSGSSISQYGILLAESDNISIKGNNITPFVYNILLEYSDNITIHGNNVSSCHFGGGSWCYGIFFSHDSIFGNITNNTVKYNHDGIRIIDGSNATIINNTIEDNTNIGIFIDSLCYTPKWGCKDPLVRGNNIAGNINYGLYFYRHGGPFLNATLNWWGEEYGPTHPSNPYWGIYPTGDKVNDGVLFDPWLWSPAF